MKSLHREKEYKDNIETSIRLKSLAKNLIKINMMGQKMTMFMGLRNNLSILEILLWYSFQFIFDITAATLTKIRLILIYWFTLV